jgi:hypothetical protein
VKNALIASGIETAADLARCTPRWINQNVVAAGSCATATAAIGEIDEIDFARHTAGQRRDDRGDDLLA